ncbi:unnamed protein product [Polarella glacialis]|uniref:Uncharacterized protein n=1 Tax=Polarella glacialis TaxID=89957 RepID=A0A813GQH5_POLGL|nr:unnamed protein product [Polarella glacialis]
MDSSRCFTKELFGVWLCVEDCARSLPLCRHVLAILGRCRCALAFARTRPQLHPAVLTLEAWSQLYESFVDVAEQCGLHGNVLTNLLSYKYAAPDGTSVFPDALPSQRLFPWSFKAGSETQFMRNLWFAMMPGSLLTDPFRTGLSHGTYLKLVGMDTYSCHNSVYYDPCRQPIAVLAMDAVYGQSILHKFFHLASLFVLDDGKVAFMFVFADNLEDIMWQEQNLFQGVILICNHLCELMSAASSLFGCSPWIMSGEQLLWFGLAIAQDDHYYKAWLALREGLSSHTVLAELQEWIEYDLHPDLDSHPDTTPKLAIGAHRRSNC